MEFLKTLFDAFNFMPFILLGVVTGQVYNIAKYAMLTGSLPIDASLASTLPVYCMLTTDSYTPDVDAHHYYSDVTNQVSGAGYTEGGAALSAPSLTLDDTNNLAKFDAGDVLWGSATITARYAVLYGSDSAGTGQSPLIAFFDFGSDQTSTAGNFLITWASGGILQIT